MGKKKKTKEEKIISELRRKLALQQTQNTSFHPKETREEKSSLTLPEGTSPKIRLEKTQLPFLAHGKAVSLGTRDYSYLGHDLKKVAILTGLAILFQFVLYLALR